MVLVCCVLSCRAGRGKVKLLGFTLGFFQALSGKVESDHSKDTCLAWLLLLLRPGNSVRKPLGK